MKCLTGLLFLMQVKGTESFDTDGRAAQEADATLRIWGTVMDFMMQVLVITLAVASGFAVGRLSNSQVETTTPARIRATRDVEGQTSELVFVTTSELTMDALRLRLREVGAAVGGNKEDLVVRYDSIRRERQLAIARQL